MRAASRYDRLASALAIALACAGVVAGCGGHSAAPPEVSPNASASLAETAPSVAAPAEAPPIVPEAPPAAAPGDSLAAAPPREEGWTGIPLPDGTTFYVRYGKPGGVRIQSGTPAGESPPPGAAAAPPAAPAAPSTAAPATAPPAATPVSPLTAISPDSLSALVRRLLAEELAALPRAPRYRLEVVSPVKPAAPAAPDTAAVPGVAAPDTAAVPSMAVAVPGVAAPDTVAVPSMAVAVPGVAAPADTALARAPATPAAPETVWVESRVQPSTAQGAALDEALLSSLLLLFETNSAELLPVTEEALAAAARILRDHPEARVRVEGYSDRRGSAKANLELSRRRAEAVRDFLVAKGGIAEDRVEVEAHGEENPLSEGSTPTALALNRRVKLRVLNP